MAPACGPAHPIDGAGSLPGRPVIKKRHACDTAGSRSHQRSPGRRVRDGRAPLRVASASQASHGRREWCKRHGRLMHTAPSPCDDCSGEVQPAIHVDVRAGHEACAIGSETGDEVSDLDCPPLAAQRRGGCDCLAPLGPGKRIVKAGADQPRAHGVDANPARAQLLGHRTREGRWRRGHQAHQERCRAVLRQLRTRCCASRG